MKNKFLLVASLFIGAVAFAQTAPATFPNRDQPAQTTVTPVTTTLATDIATTAYVAYPEQLKGLKSETLTSQHFFPALGTYKASGSSTGDVTIALDETNKGIVWVEGLSQGRFKAIMKKAPSTYKIPAQTTESGKAVPEGTLFFNPTTKELTVLLGRPFDDTDPTSSLTMASRTKSKVWQYTGVKAEVITAVEPPNQQ